MRTEGRAKSKNVVNTSDGNFSGRRNQFVNESLRLATENHKPSTKLGKQGKRKTNTGYKTGGGF